MTYLLMLCEVIGEVLIGVVGIGSVVILAAIPFMYY